MKSILKKSKKGKTKAKRVRFTIKKVRAVKKFTSKKSRILSRTAKPKTKVGKSKTSNRSCSPKVKTVRATNNYFFVLLGGNRSKRT